MKIKYEQLKKCVDAAILATGKYSPAHYIEYVESDEGKISMYRVLDEEDAVIGWIDMKEKRLKVVLDNFFK